MLQSLFAGASARRRRWSVASRVVAAVVGGYALTSLLTLALSLLLPALMSANQAQAVLATTMVSYLGYAGIIMAVFHARTAVRAWMGLLVAAVPPTLVILLLLPATRP